ncbi:hypothetical protein Focb16_v001989 [Fusarium oxysporum f. sp. cubense]|uniref:Transcription factor domain-containing protein n=1 Tax=Fusarium oxysporum f. sp. cubense TaxID=61366 RepID=A0A559L921_FUSOC|nr:hypothetical protein Focb16_v001989 [Fusarium oxysporum f. sp. cubense]
MLVSFNLENVDCIYAVIHVPSFRRQYHEFWEHLGNEVDRVWLVLLFTIISLGALVVSLEVAESICIDGTSARNLAHTWHSASRQALFSGGFESRPRLLQIAVLLATQVYGESLNSCLGQAVRNAQAQRPSLIWQHYILHCCARLQQMRMVRPFLSSQPEAHAITMQTAGEILDAYKFIRRQPALRRNPKFYATAYQAYSSAVHLAALLLVERSAPESLQNGVEIVIEDLEANILGLPATLDGCKVLRKMLWIYDHRGAAGTPESIASEIGPVFGGESTPRKYLGRCGINYLLNQNQPAFTRGANDEYDKPIAGLNNHLSSMSLWTCLVRNNGRSC